MQRKELLAIESESEQSGTTNGESRGESKQESGVKNKKVGSDPMPLRFLAGVSHGVRPNAVALFG